jgi:hypothetical protein
MKIIDEVRNLDVVTLLGGLPPPCLGGEPYKVRWGCHLPHYGIERLGANKEAGSRSPTELNEESY